MHEYSYGRLTAILLTILLAATAQAQTLVGGFIDQDTTWDRARSPFFVDDDVIVRKNATLTIEPGVEVLFREDTGIRVGVFLTAADHRGMLIADGTPDEPIIFALAVGGTGQWTGIEFGYEAVDAVTTTRGQYLSGCIVRHARITGASKPIFADESNPFVQSLTITDGDPAISISVDADQGVWVSDVDIQTIGRGLEIRHASDVRIMDVDLQTYAVGLYVQGSNVSIEDVDVQMSVVGPMRAVDIHSATRVRIVDASFRQGGINIRFSDTPDTILLIDTIEVIGGGINVTGADRSLVLDSLFERSGVQGLRIGGSGEIRRCVFRDNNVLGPYSQGGGALVSGDGWLIEDCLFEGNYATGTSGSFLGRGGGLYFSGENLTLRRCDFIGNTSEFSAGGAQLDMYDYDSTCLVEDCTFVGNIAERGSGAGLLAGSTTGWVEPIIVRDCVFEDNAGFLSGGMTINSSNAWIIDNLFRNNTATESAGALRVLNESSRVLIAGNQFIENTTLGAGGAIDLFAIRGDGMRIEGNTFKDNSALLGGVLHVGEFGSFSMSTSGGVANRLSGNTADAGSAIYNDSRNDIDATGVCWGTDDPLEIAAMIFDQADDPTKGVVLVDPIATDCPEACRADLDGDGQLTIFDFLQFQNLFDAGDPIADFDGDGALTIFDFLAFQNAFDAGCE